MHHKKVKITRINLFFQLDVAKVELSTSIINEVLDGIVSASRRRDLYGGDLVALMSMLTDAVNRSATHLLPLVDPATAEKLVMNISSVS